MIADMFGEIATTWARLGFVVLSSACIIVGVIAYVRLVGLRSFSKMSSFDFAVTVAIGSIVGGTAMSSSSLVDGMIAIGALLCIQLLIAAGRSRFELGKLIDNEPIFLMLDGQLVHENLRRGRVTADDVRAKLRSANVLDTSTVRAVVLETTGDVTVLHGPGPLELDIVSNVRR